VYENARGSLAGIQVASVYATGGADCHADSVYDDSNVDQQGKSNHLNWS
jgi:hypothetical protein